MNKKLMEIQDKHWTDTFKLADTCLEMNDNGISYQDIALIINKTADRAEQLVRMATYFPLGTRILNIPISIYEQAALFPDPIETIRRAWNNNLQADDLSNEIGRWARRFDALGYGDPPCIVPANAKRPPRQTPIEEALGVDDQGMTTAKKLYAFLELRPDNYSRWLKKNITENIFADENADYFSLVLKDEWRNSGIRGHFAEDYKLTARFAKKLAMTSQSEKGEMARDYFITVEERAKAIANGQRPTGRIPAEDLLGIVDKFGDRLDKYLVNRMVRLALTE